MSPEGVLRWTTTLFGAACVVLAAERLVALRRNSLWAKINQCLAVQNTQFSQARQYHLAKTLIQVLKLAGGMGCVILSLLHRSEWMFAALIPVTAVLIYDRALEHVGGDGADQQLRIIGVALSASTLGGLFSTSAASVGLAFLACQLACCYTVAGIAKLANREWRNGDALRCLAASYAFGNPLFSRWCVRHPPLAVVASWGVMLFEASFLLAIFSPVTALAGLSLAFAFHLCIAITMRLNSFLWVFPIAYPAFYYTACHFPLRW